MNAHLNINLKTIVDEKLGVVTVQATGPSSNFWATGIGSSRCSGPDKFDPEIGLALATARALKQLAREIDRDARETVAERDSVRDAAEATRIKNLEGRKARGAAMKEANRLGAVDPLHFRVTVGGF